MAGNGSMASRYELTEGQWNRIRDLLPGRKETAGRTAADNQVFVNGVLWILRSGNVEMEVPRLTRPQRQPWVFKKEGRELEAPVTVFDGYLRHLRPAD
jgi:transposase